MIEDPPARLSTGARLRWLALALALLGSLGAALWLLWPAAPPPAPQEPAGCAGRLVELSPVGQVCFPRAPRRAVTLDANYNDMLVALGQGSRVAATGYQGNHTEVFYRQIPGFEAGFQEEALPHIGATLDKETLYALGAEVHHIDPERLVQGGRWTREGVAEVARNVGPFFANRYSREQTYPGDRPYRYYDTWELTETLGQVYRQEQRAQALAALYRELERDLQARLPAPDARPRVGLLMLARGRFTPFSLSRPGFGTAQYRAVGARDAFAPIQGQTYADAGRAPSLDIEGLLALDPEVIIMPFAIYPSFEERYQQLLEALRGDALASKLQAVRQGRVYPGGSPLQGPLFLLFQTEMAAKQLYPDTFGPFRPDHQYPPQEQLFDRGRLAAILRGSP